MNHIESFIPNFSGFYESIWNHSDIEIEQAYLIQDIEDNEYFPYHRYSVNEIAEAICDCMDYKSYENEIAKEVVEFWQIEAKHYDLISSMELQNVDNPKEYNFKTDKLIVDVYFTDGQKNRLIKLFEDNKPLFENYIYETYSSRSGFISFHSNDVYSEEWQDFINDEHKFMVVVMLILEKVFETDMSEIAIYDFVETRFDEFIDFDKLKAELGIYLPNHDYICEITGEPLNEYNYFDYHTIQKAKEYERLMGKKPKVYSFEYTKHNKHSHIDENLANDKEQNWFEMEDSLNLESQ